MATRPTRFNFFANQDICVPICYPSPVQTVSGGCNWLYEDYDDAPLLDISDTHAAAIKSDGTLWLWGCNADYGLGDLTFIAKSSPIQTVSQGSNWKQISFGDTNSAAIKTDGTLWLWGYGFSGQLGNGIPYVNQSSPVQTVSQGNNWKQVSINIEFTGAVKTDGTLWVWGRNVQGSLGTNTSAGVNIPSPVQTIAGGNNWKNISTGCQFSAALKTDGTLWLWGNSLHGRMGDQLNISQSSPVQTISSGSNWKQVSVGYAHAAAIKTDGTLWAWGYNTAGQLGNNTAVSRSSPVQTISSGTNWTNVQVGDCTTASFKTDGTMWLWGSGLCGALGDNTVTNKSSPVQTVSTGTDWKQVRLGGCRGIATKNDGTLWTWGDNGGGILGTNNTTTFRSSPVQTVSTGTNWTEECAWCSFDAYQNSRTAAIKSDGTLWLWGYNSAGILGNNNRNNQSSPVQTVSTGTNWKQVALGLQHSASIKTDGTLWLWGCGGLGRLGNNCTINFSSPVQTVSTGTNWKQVSARSGFSTAAIKTDGTLWLWGENGNGYLGILNTLPQSSPVQTVSTGTNWKQVAVGRTVAAIKTDGTLWVWGSGTQGSMGNNDTIHQSSPVQTISTGTNWKQVASGCFQVAAVKTDGTLWVWGGNNTFGQLGDFTSNSKSSPIQTVSTGTNWKQVSASLSNMAAIKTDGTLWTWGFGNYLALGNNNTINHSSPIQTISNNTNWKQVSSGQRFVAAIDNNNRLYLWGFNNVGQLANDLFCAVVCRSAIDFDDVFVRRDIFSEGGLWIWGSGLCGALGNNSTINQSSPVQTISGGTNWKQVQTGPVTAAIKTDGTLWLWGNGYCGALGNNAALARSSPVQTVSTGTDWKQVSVSSSGAVGAIKTDGTLWMWGCNIGAQLGDNTSIIRSSPVQTVSTGTNWKQVSTGSSVSFAVKTDGTLWSWGFNNYGPLGNNNTIAQSSPVQTVSQGTNWKQVSAGTGAIIGAIKTDGTLWMWGRNNSLGGFGGLGNNSTISQSSPVQTVSTGTNWKFIATGESTSSAIKTDGTLWLWGSGLCGVLGNNSVVSVSSPVQTISTGTNWKQAISGGPNQMSTAAIKTDGTLWVWGRGLSGVLGNNSTIDQSSPVQTISGGTNWKQVHSASIFLMSAIREDCW